MDGEETSTAPTGTVASTVAPVETQRAAANALLTLIQADSTVSAAAKLSTSYDDVTTGINSSSSGNNDTNYPFNSATETSQLYPTGTTNRGVLYSSLSSAEKRAVLDAIGAWVVTQKDDVVLDLYFNYVNPTALAQTYVAYSPGESGIADFGSFPNLKATPLLTQGSYTTNLLIRDQVSVPSTIADYEKSAGGTRVRISGMGGLEPGDPEKFAHALLRLADTKRPPLRIAPGDDAIRMALQKAASIRSDIEAGRTLGSGLALAPT